jgi:hypothetical protein
VHNQAYLDALRDELRRRELPREYVDRVVREIADHQQDIQEEAGPINPTGRLGEVRRLADALVAEFRARTFCGRHPLLTFVLAPIPVSILAWLGTLLACTWLGSVGLPMNEHKPITDWPVFSVWCLLSLYYFQIFAPFALVSAGLCRLAYRTGRGKRWAFVACALVAFFAASITYRCKLPDAPGTGSLSVGWLLYPPESISWTYFLIGPQLVQFLVPLGIGAIVAWRLGRRSPGAELVA